MRYLDVETIENITTGTAFLGTKGGDDPYTGKMMVLSAVEEDGPIKLISPEEIIAEDLFLPATMMGAPPVAIGKFPEGDKFVRVFGRLGKYSDRETIAGTSPMEVGCVNLMIPTVVVAKLGIPLMDCDGTGRALPELPMVTFHLDGISVAPMAITDEKGSIGIMEAIDNTWIGCLVRVQTVEMGVSALASIYPATGKQSQDYRIRSIVTLSEEVGRVIRGTYTDEQEKCQALMEVTDGLELSQEKILDVEREVKGGFNLGRVKLSDLNSDVGSEAIVHFQDGDLIVEEDGQVAAMMPDLTCMVDLETLTPATAENLKYGKHVQVTGLRVNVAWRAKKDIETVDPRHFGYEMNYQPLENSIAKGDK